jgi:hypothetical protein
MASTIAAGTTSGTAIAIAGDTSGVLQLQTNGTTAAVTINTSQNVGIGTSSPSVKLDVVGNSAAVQASESGGASVRIAAGGSTGFTGTYSNHPLAFLTNSAEAMRITSGGALCVGTTSNTGTVRFIVESDTTTLNPMTVSNTRSTAATDYSIIFYRAGNIVGSVQTTLSATSFVTSSDYRLKENIAPMTGALSKVAQLNPVTYDWKAGGSSQGFIAHELQAVVPDCVVGDKDEVDADGNIKPQGVDTSFLVATLTAAIQELNAKVEAQAVRIAELEGAR